MESVDKTTINVGRRNPKRKFKMKYSKSSEKAKPSFDIPGVTRVKLGKRTQAELECVVGENVTSENPWKFVQKELIEDSMIFNEESEFLPLRLDIAMHPRDKILVGYVPNENDDFDEFYLCLTESAADTIFYMITKIRQEQEAALKSAQYKSVGKWISLGSEVEIAEYSKKANRALLEVEVEASYPVISPKIRFTIRRVQSARDGYMELLPDRTVKNIVRKLRSHLGSQVTPITTSRSSQTNYSFPKNAWTQYHFEYDKVGEITEEFSQNFLCFTSSKLDDFCNQLQINYNINLYSDDYTKLVTDLKYTISPEGVLWNEYMSFADLYDARHKMISSVSWHPTWSGTVAIAYGHMAPNVYNVHRKTVDEVNAIVHEKNPILIWCISDGLKPKLYLECKRQVECISFCPFDENIIVGAGKNGQIFVWDIRNKLNKVEEIEILTAAQQKYKVLMKSLMKWMKNTYDISHVRTTIESSLEFSHGSVVTGITWIPPYCKMTKSGKYELIKEGKPSSLQFATSSADGSVLFWDLLVKPVAGAAGEYKAVKKLRRLKARPSALTIDVSPFRNLNRNLMPFYKLTFFNAKKDNYLLLSSIATLSNNILYEIADKSQKYSERIIYKPIVSRPNNPPQPEIICGSYNGYMLKVNWEGYDVDPGNTPATENIVISSIGRYHDGPVTCVMQHPSLSDTYLTVGGKVFAIWKTGYKDRPIIWRKARHRYTHGTWTKTLYSITLCKADGNREVWNFLKRSDKLYIEQSLSGSVILGSYRQYLPESNLLGISDYNGSFRMFYIPNANLSPGNELELKALNELFQRNVNRKETFTKWQNAWLAKNAVWIKERQDKLNVYKQKLLEREQVEKKRRSEEKIRLEKERRLLAAQNLRPPPGEYLKWAQAKWEQKEHDRMRDGILLKKRLKPNLLVAQQMPLKLLEQEEERKKKKQKERLQDSENIFNETVAMLFPDFIKKKPPPPWNPYGGGDSIAHKQECIDDYNTLSKSATEFIQSHPFQYNFNWKYIVQKGIQRRRLAEKHIIKSHRLRREDELASKLDALSVGSPSIRTTSSTSKHSKL